MKFLPIALLLLTTSCATALGPYEPVVEYWCVKPTDLDELVCVSMHKVYRVDPGTCHVLYTEEPLRNGIPAFRCVK